MKATSKLISVVLILALCLSIFAVSASAEIIIPSEDGTTVLNGGSLNEVTNGEGGETFLPPTTNNVAPEVTVVEVDSAEKLGEALRNGALSIKLTNSFTVEGPLNLGAVTIDFNNCTLTVNGKGPAAVIASGARFNGGQLIVTGAVTDAEGNTTGFDTVASGSVVFRNMNMNLAGDTVLGNVAVVSGTFNKDVTANIADGSRKAEPATVEDGQPAADGLFVVEEIPADTTVNPPVDPDKKDEVVNPDKKDEVVDPDKKDDADVEQKDGTDLEQKDQEDSFTNEDPVTIEKPEEKQDVEEVRVDPKAQEAAEEKMITLTATDEVTGAVVTVRGYMPEGLTLVVKHLDNSVIGGLEEDEVALLAVDISLEDAEHNVYEPFTNEDPNFRAVTVSITHPSLKNLAEDETLVIYHLAEEGTETKYQNPESEGTDTASFSTSSFSPFVIVAKTGTGTARTGSDGEVHRKTIKIKNTSGETYIKGGTGITFSIEGGAAPESISIIDPDNVAGGNLAVYQQGYLLVGTDYDLGNFNYSTGQIANPTQPVTVTIYDSAVIDAPNGKWAVVFWFRDTANSGDSTRVYMVQYVNIVPQLEIKGVGYNYDEDTKTFEAEKCDYDSIEVLLTADLESFMISGGGGIYAYYNRDESTKKMMVHFDGKDRTVNASEYFTVSDYYATDPLGHEYVAGKSLKIHDTLLKKLINNRTYQLDVSQSNKKDPINAASDTFFINLTPGIAVADGLTDYIKGRNTWIKFIACAPIDYDDDGTLAIWIGGQKISHQYYSISNDHQTLWIYRNLLDQLKSNNSYTLTARLWEYTTSNGVKVKTTYYPATASFNILAAGSTSYRSPKTGDESNVALWAAVLVLSGGAVIALVPKKKKGK